MYERCMGSCAIGVNCAGKVLDWVKSNTMRWFGHIERMGSEEIVKKVYTSESVDPNGRGRPPGRWRDRVKSMCERGVTRGARLDQVKRECLDREKWRLFCHGHPFGGDGIRHIDG